MEFFYFSIQTIYLRDKARETTHSIRFEPLEMVANAGVLKEIYAKNPYPAGGLDDVGTYLKGTDTKAIKRFGAMGRWSRLGSG